MSTSSVVGDRSCVGLGLIVGSGSMVSLVKAPRSHSMIGSDAILLRSWTADGCVSSSGESDNRQGRKEYEERVAPRDGKRQAATEGK